MPEIEARTQVHRDGGGIGIGVNLRRPAPILPVPMRWLVRVPRGAVQAVAPYLLSTYLTVTIFNGFNPLFFQWHVAVWTYVWIVLTVAIGFLISIQSTHIIASGFEIQELQETHESLLHAGFMAQLQRAVENAIEGQDADEPAQPVKH